MQKEGLKKGVNIPDEYKYACAFLTMRCNLNCIFCLNSLDKSKEFNRNKFKEISGEEWVNSLNKIDSRPDVPITFSGGEPFLHKDFIYIINNLKPELNIDILTNLYPSSKLHKKRLEQFANEVNPARIKRNSPYASIRVSYHPEQMDAKTLVNSVGYYKNAGFSIGIWGVLYPSPDQLSAINQMQFRCRDAGIDFRLKEYTGVYKEDFYGDYTKYPMAVNGKDLKNCLCKTSELLMGPNGDIYKCHRDLFNEEFPTGNIKDPDFQIKSDFKRCNKYGNCHPCDVKVKTNYKQQLGHTSVEIKFQ